MPSLLPLKPEHASAMIEIARHSFPKVWKLEEFQYFLNHRAARSFGIFESETLISYCLALLAGGTLDIISLATHEGSRRKGFALQLMGEYMKDPFIQEIHLEVMVGNDSAILFYKKLGFAEQGVRKKYYANKHDALVMNWKR